MPIRKDVRAVLDWELAARVEKAMRTRGQRHPADVVRASLEVTLPVLTREERIEAERIATANKVLG